MTLLGQRPAVINIGLREFNKGLAISGTRFVHLDWRPPLAVKDEARFVIQRNQNEIDRANAEAIQRIVSGRPVLVGLQQAIEVIPGMAKELLLHAGPPVDWESMCGPMKGAVIGALIYERLAANPSEAESLAASGKIRFEPCHAHGAVGPMAGVISASMPVWVVKNETFGNYAYSTMNEGLGKVLRYGAYGPEVIERLRWMEDVLYPVLAECITKLGGIDLKLIIASALHMGDEVHNRNRAATSLLYRTIAPLVVKSAANAQAAAQVFEFINANDHFFLNLSMAACKTILDAARNIPASSLVIAMARNGVEFGIQLSGTGDRWFTGPAPIPDALFFPGFGPQDANPDLGDSAITETCGLGGFAIAAAPAIVGFVGGNVNQAISCTTRMYEITVAENTSFQIPYLNFRGTPTGIDIRKVIKKNILPFIDTGVAHKEPGIGQIGAGILTAPVEPFLRAFHGLAEVMQQHEAR